LQVDRSAKGRARDERKSKERYEGVKTSFRKHLSEDWLRLEYLKSQVIAKRKTVLRPIPLWTGCSEKQQWSHDIDGFTKNTGRDK
jgi:hypothetical protein